MFVFIVWKISISGWNKEIEKIFSSEEKARERIKMLSGSGQFYYSFEKRIVN